VRQALEGAGLAQREVAVEVGGRGAAESFELAARDGTLVVTGADPAGAMYGAFEAASASSGSARSRGTQPRSRRSRISPTAGSTSS
jgi:hypothetical protein